MGNTLEKKRFQLPHIYVLLFCIITIVTILTWIVPAGSFEYVVDEVTGKTVAVPDSYHTIESSPVGPFKMFQLIYAGYSDAASIIFFVFISYASVGIVIASGCFNGLVAAMLKIFKGKFRVAIIPIFMLIIGLCSSTVGLFEEWYPFIPVFAGISVAMGFDAIVGMGIVCIGAAVGYSGAMFNPFTVGIAQGIAEVPLFSGVGFRFASHMAMLAVSATMICRYALKVQADPTKSVLYGETINLDLNTEADVTNAPFGIREKSILAILIGSIVVMVYGCKVYGWYFQELSAVFLIMGIICALIQGWGPNTIATKMSISYGNVARACMTIGLSRGILLILKSSNLIDTVVYYVSRPLSAFPEWLSGVSMLVIQTLLNCIIPSGSGQAATIMPIMTPIADMLNVARDTAVLAFQFGDGVSNILWPTAAVATICALGGIKIEKWWKFFVPIFCGIFTSQVVMMIIAVLIRFGAA